MTKEQTRQLGIEFERRIQTINPYESVDKIDTDTIYSILNEAAVSLVKKLCVIDDNVKTGTRLNARLNDFMRTLVTHNNPEIILYDNNNKQDQKDFSEFGDCLCVIAKLPKDYYSYIRSSSRVERVYSDELDSPTINIVSNKLIKQQDVFNILNKPYNKHAILRSPLVIMEQKDDIQYIKVFHDQYSDIIGIDLVYYRLPHKFNIINNNEDVLNYCELPYDTFEEILNIAVLLYIQYKNPQKATENKQQKQDNEEDNNDRS